VIWPHYASVDHGSNFARAAEAARHAIQLDDTLAEAHATLDFVAFDNWSSASAQAEHEFRRALELNPSYATAHHWYSFHLIFSRRLDEALAELEVARQLDPLSAIINADEGHLLYAMGRYNDAESRLHRAIELAPGLGQPHETLALIDLAAERTSGAVTEARAGLALDALNPRTMGEAGYVLAATGHTEEAARLLTSLNDLVRRESAYPMYASLVYIGLGQKSQALDMLEAIAKSPRGAGLVALVQWPTAFSQLNAEPRYRELLAGTGR
jgi:Tfp pilus assembly protein PilF